MWHMTVIGALVVSGSILAGCGGERSPDPMREDAAVIKGAVTVSLDAATQARAGERAGDGWRVRTRPVAAGGIGRATALTQLQGPRAGWPRVTDFAPPAPPDGPARRIVQMQGAAVLGYPGVRVAGWVNLDLAGRIADLHLRGARSGRIAVVRSGRDVQVAAAIGGAPVVLTAPVRGRALGRFTQVVEPQRCDGSAPEWANLRATIAGATRTSSLLESVPRRAWAHAASLPLATQRRPYAPTSGMVRIEGTEWLLAARSPLDGRLLLQRMLPGGPLRGCR